MPERTPGGTSLEAKREERAMILEGTGMSKAALLVELAALHALDVVEGVWAHFRADELLLAYIGDPEITAAYTKVLQG
jgi:hypothetical protein